MTATRKLSSTSIRSSASTAALAMRRPRTSAADKTSSKPSTRGSESRLKQSSRSCSASQAMRTPPVGCNISALHDNCQPPGRSRALKGFRRPAAEGAEVLISLNEHSSSRKRRTVPSTCSCCCASRTLVTSRSRSAFSASKRPRSSTLSTLVDSIFCLALGTGTEGISPPQPCTTLATSRLSLSTESCCLRTSRRMSCMLALVRVGVGVGVGVGVRVRVRVRLGIRVRVGVRVGACSP